MDTPITDTNPKWQDFPITQRADGSYIIVNNSLPYHVPNEGEWEELWQEVYAYAQAHPDAVTQEVPPPSLPEPSPEEVRVARIKQIDQETTQAILAGFNHEVQGIVYHFAYDAFDQQNFADTANACILLMQGVEGLPQTVTWNAYKDSQLVRLTLTAQDFLQLYTAGALAHKALQMEIGGQKKAVLNT